MTGEVKFAGMTIPKEGGSFAKLVAGASNLMLFVTGALYTFAYVKSFIWARKNQGV